MKNIISSSLFPVSQNGSRKWAKPETDEGVQSRLSAHLTTCQNEMDFSASANKHIYAMFIWSYSFPFLNLLRQGYHLQIKQGQKRHRFYETDNKVCFGELFWPKLLSHESQWRVSRPSEAYGAGRRVIFRKIKHHRTATERKRQGSKMKKKKLWRWNRFGKSALTAS